MKNCALSFCLIFSSFLGNAQWTNTAFSNDGPLDYIYHNNTLMGTYVLGLKYSTNNGQTWTRNSLQNVYEPFSAAPLYMFCAGKYAYIFTVNLSEGYTTMIYRSEDNFITFEVDTAGLAKAPINNECIELKKIFYADGYFYAQTESNGNWVKPVEGKWSKATAPELNGYLEGHNGILCSNINRFSISLDHGESWIFRDSNNYLKDVNADRIYTDKHTGRIYVYQNTFADVILLYTDDTGSTWNNLNVRSYLKKNEFTGFTQSLEAMYAKGDVIYLGFMNDSNNTPVEMLRSFDGGKNFVMETNGLQQSASRISYVKKFVENNGTLITLLYSEGLYRREYKLDIPAKNTQNTTITIYPNPATNILYVDYTKGLNTTMELYTTTGQKVEGIELNADNSINVASLARGMYILKVKEGNTYVGSQLFIKQ